jgi:hypothetical protein
MTINRWKLGQVSPGTKIQFQCIRWDAARRLSNNIAHHLQAVSQFAADPTNDVPDTNLQNLDTCGTLKEPPNPKLRSLHAEGRPSAVFRQVVQMHVYPLYSNLSETCRRVMQLFLSSSETPNSTYISEHVCTLSRTLCTNSILVEYDH